MTRFVTAAAAAALVALPLVALPFPAFANGGDREPAGGAFMSSYVTNPYATSRSPAEARPLDRPAPWLVPDVIGPDTTGSVRALPARRRTHR
ncbi:hypothetical protein [Methylobacterium frigidaeris]|uniref:Uncharacterized protein n=1 Tax=Methylobacterium frigidaeris TaxID=2038277 RepID=A0AA37M3E0_9HYPH|nr:hypothetical protein [Methylobacterium frigidaeris]PIK73893.1 hypothetical protein CS379_05695 [Methylobacterium frigidaeris]GJD61030.1 hypothetical protein MPEAHAMD_1170 [Methylobacterium frigidaeris]